MFLLMCCMIDGSINQNRNSDPHFQLCNSNHWAMTLSMDMVSNKEKSKESQAGNPTTQIIKFFVANIPDGCRPWDLADVMKAFGEVSGVFIAKRKNKNGERFGFVGFKRVQDSIDLENRLQKVKIGKWSLKINVARYARENHFKGNTNGSVRSNKITNSRAPVAGAHLQPPFASKGPAVHSGNKFSYRDAVSGSSGVAKEEAVIIMEDAFEGASSLFNRAVVVRCASFDDLNSLPSLLGGFASGVVSIQYIGGLFSLLSFNDEKEAKGFLYMKESWRSWLSRVEIWNGQSLPFERIAWVGVYGLPLNLATAEVVNRIGAKFGVVVNPSVAKVGDVNKSVECVGLLVGDGFNIRKVISLKWRQKTFRVWVEEKYIDWCPPCGPVSAHHPPSSSSHSPPVSRSDKVLEDGEIPDIVTAAVDHSVVEPISVEHFVVDTSKGNCHDIEKPIKFASPTPAVERAVKGGNSSIDWDFNISSNSSRPKKRPRKAISDFLDDLEELRKSDEDNVFMGAPLANSEGDIQKQIASLFEDSSGEHDGEGPDGEQAVPFEHDRDDLVKENFTRLDEHVTSIYNEVTNSEVEQADMNQDPELLSEVRGTMEIGDLLQMNMEGFEAIIEQAIIRERSSCPLQHPTDY